MYDPEIKSDEKFNSSLTSKPHEFILYDNVLNKIKISLLCR